MKPQRVRHSPTLSLLGFFGLLIGAVLIVTPAQAGASTASTTVFDASTNAAWSGTESTGASAFDTMTLAGNGMATPTGTVTYSFYNNGTCTNSPEATDPVIVSSNGTVPNSIDEGPLSAGSYSYRATYGGDANNTAVTSSCEGFTVSLLRPTLNAVVDDGTNAWGSSEPIGSSATGTAALSGYNPAFTPTGSVTYSFYNNGTCTSPPASTQQVTLAPGGSVPSSTPTAGLALGTYSLQVAYGGDANYSITASACVNYTVVKYAGDTLQSTVVDASTGNPWTNNEQAGATAYDKAVITNFVSGFVPSGSVTYSLYSNGTCGGSPTSQSVVTVNSDGSVPNSPTTSSLSSGDYSYQASYSGDPNYAAVSAGCEFFGVGIVRSTPTMTFTLYVNGTATPWNSPIPSNATFWVSATLQGINSVVPTGTVDFIVYLNGCAVEPADLGPVTLSGGSASSQQISGNIPFTNLGWTATYSGDINYSSVSSTCETTTISTVTSPYVTTNPLNATAPIGGSATFTAAGSGAPTPTVQWQASVDGGSSWIPLSGQTSTSLTIGSVAAVENGWQFRAVFSNQYGTATTMSATLGVIPATAILVPSNTATFSGTQTVDASATSGVGEVQFEITGGTLTDRVVATATLTNYGWIASWNTTNVPNGTYSLQSVASFPGGPQGTSSGVTVTISNGAPTTAVVRPSSGTTTSGNVTLDATASSGVASVQYEITGGPFTGHVVATATLTIYGWVASWNTTTVPNGNYALQSVASYAFGGVSGTSQGIRITVNNTAPATSVLIPAAGTSLSTSVLLDASATSGVTTVVFEISGGSLTNYVIGTGSSTLYGWLAFWNTASVPDGTYSLQSVASYPGGVSGTSAPVSITVAN